MRLFAERARQSEELVEAHQFHFELGHWRDVAGQERRTITRVFVQDLECFADARKQLEKLYPVARYAPRFFS